MGQRSVRKISCGQDSSLALDVKVVGVRFEGSKGTFSDSLLRGEKSQKGLEKIHISAYYGSTSPLPPRIFPICRWPGVIGPSTNRGKG